MHICDLELSRAWAVSTLHEGTCLMQRPEGAVTARRLVRERVCVTWTVLKKHIAPQPSHSAPTLRNTV